MYKPLADSTLMGMTKKEIIEQLRIAEHNFKAMEETVNQQAENFIKLLAEERKHGHWIYVFDNEIMEPVYKCSLCKKTALYQCFSYDTVDSRYCPHCGAKMDGDTK